MSDDVKDHTDSGTDQYGVLLYYKYAQIPHLHDLLTFYESNCSSLGLLGRVRLSSHGVNVTVILLFLLFYFSSLETRVYIRIILFPAIYILSSFGLVYLCLIVFSLFIIRLVVSYPLWRDTLKRSRLIACLKGLISSLLLVINH